jgi:transcriptional regulator with XRE-family HTH domain
MVLTEESRIMEPAEMREIRTLAGWTLTTLSQKARINIAQLSQFETGQCGLNPTQLARCRKLLLAAAAERAAEIATLFAREHAVEMAEMAAAS